MSENRFRAPVVLLCADDSDAAVGVFDATWTRQSSLHLPVTPWDLSSCRWVWVGEIDSEPAAVAAVEALSRGVGLLIEVSVQGRVRQRLLEDLHASGEVISPLQPGAPTMLDSDQQLLIETLAAGTTLTQAAHDLNLSRRSANRRMAEVRSALRVETTAEAIIAWTAASSSQAR